MSKRKKHPPSVDLYGKIDAALNPPPATPAEALESAADLTGWDKDSQLAVCIDFIGSGGEAISDAFAAYVKERADADIAATAIR